MVFNVGLQLGLELSQILPIREYAQSAGSRLFALARDLRKSGSDLLVEEDLAELVGRTKIRQDLETNFRKAVMKQEVTESPSITEFHLAQGARPTVMNALQDRRYM